MLSVILQASEPAHESAKKFSELDPVGVGMTVIAMSVVFLSLILLYLTFKNVARLYSIDLKKRWLEKKGKGKCKDNAGGDQIRRSGRRLRNFCFEVWRPWRLSCRCVWRMKECT